ncbi:hypothetical protein O181_104126 [Austropuccinia psidii MF-1]|uniref:Glycolipid transfer protein domain-containing protein n=1 Tax=Austropuccinia psidii MF-1 TaxID=1389203 RepID=A0A9Q3PL42_9BASI|nr:hypothetical protein [Austropuccinia psidii MF-1]
MTLARHHTACCTGQSAYVSKSSSSSAWVACGGGATAPYVPITDEGVDTEAFLEACEDLVKLFDLFGSKAFAVVQNDLTGNIAKIRNRYLAFPAESKTLERLVEHEKNEKKKDGTQGLLWLTRGLHFTYEGLRISQQNPGEELSVSFTKGYETTLKPYHSFVVKPVFGLAMKACPYRAALFEKLGPKDQVEVELEKWLTGLEKVVKRIQSFYEKGGYGKGL